MATDNNVNEFENGNENEVNEAPEVAESASLSKHAKKKALKDSYAQMRIKRKANQKKIRQQQSQSNVKELDNAGKNDIIENEENRSPVEKENPFKHDVVGQNQNRPNNNNAPDFEKENNGVDILKELNDSNVIVETEETEETEENKTEKIDAPYTIAETVLNINGNENVKTHMVSIPNFYTLRDDRIRDEKVAQQVRSEIFQILRTAGFEGGRVPFHLGHDIVTNLTPTLSSVPFNNEKTADMHKVAANAFQNSYFEIAETALSPKDKIITAQRLADVILKTYSPVAFVDGALNQYADNYVVKNRALLQEQLEKRDVQNIEAAINDVEAALADAPENEQPVVENVPAVNLNTNNEQENAVDIPQQEPPKEEPVQQEPVQQEPPKQEPPKEEPVQQEPPQQEPPKEEPPKEEPVQQEPPKEEPPKQEPLKPNLVSRQDPAKLGPEWINMPEFDQKLERLKKIAALPGNTKKRISDILRESGVETGGADDPLEFNEIIKDAYDPKKLPRDVPQSMRDITKNVFISTYDALSKKGLTPRNKIETTQRITDVFLKLYSPASLSGVKELDKYTQNYVTGDKNLLRECLTTLKVPENEIQAIVGDVYPEAKPEVKTEAKPEVKTEIKPETKPISSEARIAVYEEKLKAYNNMYKLDIDSNHFASSVTEAWELMTSGDKQKMADGQKVMNNLFKDTLKKAFDVEKGVAYNEHRLPEYAEIIKSTNELMRSAMYGFTDMYHNAKRTELFETTAFGGLNDKDMVDLTVGQSLWSMDQKSDEAWDIQSKEAKNIAEKWMKGDKPHEKMIAEMKALVEANKDNIVSRKEIVDKLTAAEWLLENDEKMMIDDPYDPYNKVPNWGNRYWKTLTETREALGIDKHTSMRDMIQADYAASAKAVNNRNYNLTQINYYVLDKDVRELADSRDVQMEQFATLSAAVTLTKPHENKELEDDMTETRKRHPVEQLNERNIMKNEPKNDKWIIEEVAHQELTILSQANAK